MHYPEMTKKYLDALRQQGDSFDPVAWNREMKAAKTSTADQNRTAEREYFDQHQPNAIAAQPTGDQRGEISREPKSIADTGKAAAYSKLRVRNDLKRLSAVWQESRTTRRRDAIYPYLKRVYCLIQKYRTAEQLDRLVCKAQKRFGGNSPVAEPYAAVVRGTTSGQIDRKAISKYARVLKYARKNRIRGGSVVAFIQGRGGLNACAESYAEQAAARTGADHT
jgi:hypothetical protein